MQNMYGIGRFFAYFSRTGKYYSQNNFTEGEGREMEEQRKKINLVVLLTFLLAVIIGIIYYLTGDPGEETLTQGTLIINMMGKDLPYVEFLR